MRALIIRITMVHCRNSTGGFYKALEPYCFRRNTEWAHLLCQHYPSHFLPTSNYTLSSSNCVYSLVEPGSRNWDLLHWWIEWLLEDMAAVCLPCLHLDHYCSHNCCCPLLFNRCKNIWQQFCQGFSHVIPSFLTKLIRTIITASAFTFLEYPDQFTLTVWLYDGNIPYFSTAHIPLFLVALTTFLFLWLPFTLILLFMQCIRKKTHHRGREQG